VRVGRGFEVDYHTTHWPPRDVEVEEIRELVEKSRLSKTMTVFSVALELQAF
jgi:hypothetical protein